VLRENMASSTRHYGLSADAKPLAIDLFCGLGGWAEGLLAENYRVIGFDVERHRYGAHRYPAQLVLQNVLTLHGSQFWDAALIVASPPCQAYSWMAMPWSRAKARAAEIRADETGRMLADLNRLFDACFRIQAQASLAAGRHVPMIVENVRGAIPWVGPARGNFGSFYLWGDVPGSSTQLSLLGDPPTVERVRLTGGRYKSSRMNWSDQTKRGQDFKRIAGMCAKLPGFRFDGSGRSFQSASVKVSDGWLNDRERTADSISSSSSKSPARKAASAMIAKIPEALARYIARSFKP